MFKTLIHAFILATSAYIGQAHAGVVTLGAGADCSDNTQQGANLQNVLNGSPSEIRLVNNVVHTGQFITSSGVNIRGGYDSCIDAINDVQGSTPSVLDGNFQGVTLTLDTNGAYLLEQVRIINGSNPTDRGGGLLLKGADMLVNLDRAVIENNEAKWGGGIFKGSNLNVLLIIKDSIIKDNFAGFNVNPNEGQGGGIYYDLGGELMVYGDTQITGNEAVSGGGVYLDTAVATFVGGDNTSIDSGITKNKAIDAGGGLFAFFSDVEISGGRKFLNTIGTVGVEGKNFNVLFNESDSDQDTIGDGGGLAFWGGDAHMEAVTVALNHSNGKAGGILAFGPLVMDRPDNTACQITNLTGCNFIVENTAQIEAGGIYVLNGTVSLQAVNFSNNRSNSATAVLVNGVNSRLTINAGVFHDNGDSGNGGLQDNYVMAIINSGQLTITQSTAVKNTASLGFIHNVNSTLNSYNNYFFNNLTGPWLTESGANPISNYECQLVDETNNTLDVTTYTYTSSLFNNDTFYFVDEANDDFHLKDNSTLVDYTLPCPFNPDLDATLKDVDGEPRTALADLGADENLSNDIIFKNGFESVTR